MRKLGLLFLLSVLFLGCSKEKSIEKNLTAGNGKWYVYSMFDNVETKYGGQWIQGSHHESRDPIGSLRFTKDGVCQFAVTNIYEEFSYTVTENTLTLINSNGEKFDYNLDWKKGKFTITLNGEFILDGMDVIIDREILCKKKNIFRSAKNTMDDL